MIFHLKILVSSVIEREAIDKMIRHRTYNQYVLYVSLFIFGKFTFGLSLFQLAILSWLTYLLGDACFGFIDFPLFILGMTLKFWLMSFVPYCAQQGVEFAKREKKSAKSTIYMIV